MNDTILFESECTYTKKLNQEYINFSINVYDKAIYKKTRINFSIMMAIGICLGVVCIHEFIFLRFIMSALFIIIGLIMIFLSTPSSLLYKFKTRNFKEFTVHFQFYSDYLIYRTEDIEKNIEYRNFLAIYEGKDFYFLEEASKVFIFLPKTISSPLQTSYIEFIQETFLSRLPSIHEHS